jgi:hypothetical protein
VTVDLPPSGWDAIGKSDDPKGYRFKAGKEDPIRRVTVRTDRIDLRGGHSSWDYTLDESSQESVALRLTLGTGTIWCAEAVPSKPKDDRTDRFRARNVAPPASCPGVTPSPTPTATPAP